MTSMLAIFAGLLAVVSGYACIVTVLWLRSRQQAPALPPVPNPSRRDADSARDKEQRIRERADEAKRLTQTFQKFVPRQFVEHFAKHGSQTLELGHADEDEVAILFCDIRGFTGLSEQMRPQELMNFLNSYFLRMNEPIHQNGGFIDKFIGDAIMALFDHPGGSAQDKVCDALNAALDLRKALDIYNQHRQKSGYAAINVGIGIHYGPVILGTVGSDDRMDTTVIGDSVNIAYRLESLAPAYDADIVISAQVRNTFPAHFSVSTRMLDWVRVKGRKAPIEIYEVLEHLPEQIRTPRQAVGAHIAAGIACRIDQSWDEALAHFNRALTLSPEDPLVQHHINICHRYRSPTRAQEWDGALPPY